MPEYGFSLVHIFPYKDRIKDFILIQENTGQKKAVFRHSTAFNDHMLMYNQPVSFDNFKMLASRNSEFHLKTKESLLISRDQPILNKNEASLPLYLFDYFLLF